MDLYIFDWRYHQNYIYGMSTDGKYVKISQFIPWKYYPDPDGPIEMKSLQGSYPTKLRKVIESTPDSILQFLSTYDIPQVGWITLSNYTVHFNEYICTVNNVSASTNTTIPTFHTVAFDIEVYSSTGDFPTADKPENKIICICVSSNLKGNHSFIGNESSILDQFYQFIKDVDILIGYNTHGFDWQYIHDRYPDRTTTSRMGNISTKWQSKSWSSSAYKNVDLFYLDIPGTLVVDMYHYCTRTFKIDNYKLNTVAKYFKIGSKDDMKPEEMWDYYLKGNISPILKYCIQDCVLVLSLVEKTKYISDLFALANVTHNHPLVLFTSGQQKRVMAMIKHECIKYNYWDKFNPGESDSYKGATVIDPEPGMYENCACMDFASLYPSIIVSENICYSTYRDGQFCKDTFGIIPNLVKSLISERNRIRSDPAMKAYSNAIKISTNSIYGVFGAKGNLHLLPAAEMITRVGRESLDKAVTYLRNNNYAVIYGDTDSCIYTNRRKLTVEEHEDIASKVTALFHEPIQMKFEAMYKRFMVLGKKMYITMDYDDNIHYKGVMPARRDSCSYNIEFYKDIVGRVMRGETFRDDCRNKIRTIRDNPDKDFYIRKTYNGIYKSPTYPLEIYNAKYGPLKKGESFDVKITYGTTVGNRMRPSDHEALIDYEWYLERLVEPIDKVMEVSGKVFRLKHNIELIYD